MPLAPFPGFCGGTYSDPSQVLLGVDRCINKYPEALESGTGKNNFGLVDVPGKDLVATLATSPGRGIWSGDETKVFCVSGSHLYQVDTDTNAVTDLGSVESDGAPVQIFHNGKSLGGQLAIVSNSKLWVVSGGAPFEVTACPASVAAGGNGVYAGTTVDSYGIVAELNTNNIYVSAPGDFTTWDALDALEWFATQDRLVQLVPDANRRLWVMGRKTAEAFGDVGGSGFPFQRIPGAGLNTGLGPRFGYAMVPDKDGVDRICFVARSDRGGPRVYTLDGYRPIRISNNSIEKIMQSYSTYLDCVANGHIRDGHSFLSLHFPTAGAALVYDFSTGMWHERYSGAHATRVEPVGRFHTAPIVTQDHYWLSGTTGNLYRDNPTIATEDSAGIYWERTGPNASNAEHQISIGTFRVDCQTATNTNVSLEVSLDNGNTFGDARLRNTGAPGKYKTIVEWHRNGTGRSFVPRVRGDNQRCALVNAMVDIEDAGAGF